ncbi:MAG: ABC transporter permease [Planctomycetia bacterium]|nr:ABC transporter permease [Planctomycetia bacterium]
MSTIPLEPPSNPSAPATTAAQPISSRGFWSETWVRFRRRKLALAALLYVGFLTCIAITAPMIVGRKPIVCSYHGSVYFPCLGYFRDGWENVVFKEKGFRRTRFAESLAKDKESWAIWPPFYQDPFVRVRANEFPGVPENPRNGGPPNRFSPFGTDIEGIDVFAQMLHASRTALLVGFFSMGIAASIGIVLGAIAGYLGGWVDTLICRFIEVVMCVPTLVLILAMIAIVERPTIWHIMGIIGVTAWPSIARLTRAEFLKLRNADFVLAAEALGAGRLRIMFRHILPNALAPVLVPITFGIASAILTESALSFIGFGPQGDPSWGKVLDGARAHLQMWWLIVFPGGAVFLAVLAYNLIGEGLQEATDPRLRGTG